MTTDNRSLDVLIAKKVTGWKGIREGNFPGFDYVGKKPLSNGENSRDDYLIPSYSTDIAAAWQVIEKLRQDHRVDISLCNNSIVLPDYQNQVRVKVFDRGEISAIEQTDIAAPLAICLAALRVVG